MRIFSRLPIPDQAREVLKTLDTYGWCKGMTFFRNAVPVLYNWYDGERNQLSDTGNLHYREGSRCLIGADASFELREVFTVKAREMFPDLNFAPPDNYSEEDRGRPWAAVLFNNHPDVTEEMLRSVLEKIAAEG